MWQDSLGKVGAGIGGYICADISGNNRGLGIDGALKFINLLNVLKKS
jgi:hypothetical protein